VRTAGLRESRHPRERLSNIRAFPESGINDSPLSRCQLLMAPSLRVDCGQTPPAQFIDYFRALQTIDSRRDALNALVGELTPYEWRALHAVTSARSFQFDIIGNLPVELVSQIFCYLDTTTPYRLQLVSDCTVCNGRRLLMSFCLGLATMEPDSPQHRRTQAEPPAVVTGHN